MWCPFLWKNEYEHKKMKNKKKFRDRTVGNWDHREECKEQLERLDKKNIASERLPVSSICDFPEMVEATTAAVAWFTPREACCSWARFGLSLLAFTCQDQADLGSHNIERGQRLSQRVGLVALDKYTWSPVVTTELFKNRCLCGQTLSLSVILMKCSSYNYQFGTTINKDDKRTLLGVL